MESWNWFKPSDLQREFFFVLKSQPGAGGLRATLIFESPEIIGVQRPLGQVVRLAKSDVIRVDEVQEGRR